MRCKTFFLSRLLVVRRRHGQVNPCGRIVSAHGFRWLNKERARPSLTERSFVTESTDVTRRRRTRVAYRLTLSLSASCLAVFVFFFSNHLGAGRDQKSLFRCRCLYALRLFYILFLIFFPPSYTRSVPYSSGLYIFILTDGRRASSASRTSAIIHPPPSLLLLLAVVEVVSFLSISSTSLHVEWQSRKKLGGWHARPSSSSSSVSVFFSSSSFFCINHA